MVHTTHVISKETPTVCPVVSPSSENDPQLDDIMGPMSWLTFKIYECFVKHPHLCNPREQNT